MRTFSRAWIAAITVVLATLVVAPAALAGVDDYPAPWRAPTPKDSMIDTWRYYNRECTSFVAWRLHSSNGFEMPHAIGNADYWGTWARNNGYLVNSVPAVGSVAWFSAGHVAWVEAVNVNGTVLIEEYNYDYNGNYHERTVANSSVTGFIHFKDLSGSVADGSFVQVSGTAAIYRIAGGAPLYVSNWNNVGGSQPYSVISQAQFNALRSVPADNTFIAAAGHVYRIAGGAPLYVSTWSAFGGGQPCVTVDGWVIDNITNPAAHLNARPGNGTLINSTATGRVYIMAGGAPLYVSNWAAIGGARASVAIDQWDLDNISHPLAHLNARPANGTCISSSADGRCYVIAGGAPIYISKWAAIGGAKPCVGVDQWAIDNWKDPNAHLNAYPADGTFLNTTKGSVYRVAGGAPVGVSTWSLFGGAQPYVNIDQWAIDTIADVHAHLLPAPADGTVVEGLPSHAFWRFSGGYRYPIAATAGAVTEDDAGLAAFPGAPIPTPTPAVTPTLTLKLSGLKSGALRLGARVTARGTVTPTSLAGSKVRIALQKKRGAAWVKVTSASATISSASAYRWKCKPARRGAYRVRAVVAKTIAHATANSAWRSFRVR